jgi:hypothetical protein
MICNGCKFGYEDCSCPPGPVITTVFWVAVAFWIGFAFVGPWLDGMM